MWIFCKQGFFSVTQHPSRKDMIQIRARAEQDLLDLRAEAPTLDRCPIHETPDADYRWRMVVARWKWEIVARALAEGIDYSNYKGKMATIPTQRHKGDMLHKIWHIHHGYQQDKHRPDPLAGHPELFRTPGGQLFSDADERAFWESRSRDDEGETVWEENQAADDQEPSLRQVAAGRRKPSKKTNR